MDAVGVIGRDDGAKGRVLHLLRELAIREAGGGLGRGGKGKVGDGAGLHDGAAYGVADEVMDPTAVAKADFGFGGMDVDVDLFGIAIEEEEGKREGARRHEVVVGRLHGVEEQFVANQAAIDE